jgi:prepilin-type processing-associated H-X9-DG protein
LEALNGDSRGDDFIPYVPNETHWQVYKTHRGSLGVFCIAGGLSGPGLRNFAPAMQDPQGLRVTWVSYTPPEGEYPPSPAMPADVTPEVAKARQLAKRSISANNIGMFLRGLHICMAQRDGRSPDDQPWPEDLRQIVEKGLRKAYDESADYLTNPERPGMRPAYVYVKPEVPLSRIHNPGREVAIYEAFDDWGGGINVGFLDGHVTFMDSEEEFRKLLNREHQKRMERYMNLGAPSSAPAAAVPTPVPAPSAQPEGEFYVLGTVRSGVFSLTGRKISLLQGLAAGGGLRPGSKTVSLLRPDGQGHTETVVTLSVETMPWKDSPLLQPGDVIYVGGEPLGAADTLTEAKAKLEALKAQYEAYRKTPLDLIPLTPEILAAVEADPQIAELKERRTRLIEARRALVERFGQQHRTVSDYDKRIDAADKEIKARRSEKANEYRRALIERVRLDMLAATAAVEQLELSGSGTGTN